MVVSLVANVINYKNKLVIGYNNDLLVDLKQDKKFFKNITSAQTGELPNIILMGKNTYYSLPNRPLKNRINFVLTNDPIYLKQYKLPKKVKDLNINKPYFITFQMFKDFYKLNNPNVFVIGGSQIYNLFLSKELNVDLQPTTLYITEVKGVTLTNDINDYIVMDHFSYHYKLVGYSEKYKQDNYSYRILTYKKLNNFSQEYLYFDMAYNIMKYGNDRIDRTNVGTKSLFGQQIKFDISSSIPLLTTKQVSFKSIVEELLFFCRGDTDAKILDRKGVKIWNANTTREFLDNRGLTKYETGIMGPMYGFSFRHYGAKYSQAFADTSKCLTEKIGGFDQLKHVEHLLKTDPFSRRIYISNLNPAETKNMCLDMCHTYIQFYVTEENGQKYLSAYFTMRANDTFLAQNYNLISYATLLYILALKCNMKPKEIIYNAVDCHVYKNHFEQMKEQMSRQPRPFPKLKLNESIKLKDWKDMTFKDFELIGYFPDKSIKMEMAV